MSQSLFLHPFHLSWVHPFEVPSLQSGADAVLGIVILMLQQGVIGDLLRRDGMCASGVLGQALGDTLIARLEAGPANLGGPQGTIVFL